MQKRIAIFVVFALTGCVLLYATSGRGGLGYFSPQTLEYCTQGERSIFGIPIYRSLCEQHDNGLIRLLIDDGYVKPDHESTAHWETVFHWNDSWRDGEGWLYHMLIRNRDAMIDWTLAHPESAKIFWPELFRHLRSTDPSGGRGLISLWREFDTPDEVREAIMQIETELAR